MDWAGNNFSKKVEINHSDDLVGFFVKNGFTFYLRSVKGDRLLVFKDKVSHQAKKDSFEIYSEAREDILMFDITLEKAAIYIADYFNLNDKNGKVSSSVYEFMMNNLEE